MTTLKSLGVTEQEAVAAIRSLRGGGKPVTPSKVTVSTKGFAFGYFSDAHIGHKKFDPQLFAYMVKFFKKMKPDFIVNPGDHLEGMSGRPGHVYELSHVGYSQQIEYAAELYSELDMFLHHGIDGNHDQWYYKKGDGGVVVGEGLQKRVKNYRHLGQDEGDLVVQGVKIKLIHPGDGTAYASSYKMERRIAALSPGEKPNVLLSGHYHKAISLFSRGVHGFECGTLCGQSSFMRGKNLAAHMGFGFIRIWTNRRGVERLDHTFVPWYEK